MATVGGLRGQVHVLVRGRSETPEIQRSTGTGRIHRWRQQEDCVAKFMYLHEEGAGRPRYRGVTHATAQVSAGARVCDSDVRMWLALYLFFNFSIGSHVRHIFKPTQCLVKILYETKILLH